MAERRLIVDKERISYDGLFSAKEFLDIVMTWLSDKGYFPIEKKHTESVKTDGKSVEIEMLPYKKVTDYAKNIIMIRILGSELKDVVVEIDGKKKKLNQGRLQVVLDGYLETDYEHRWETKPIFYFLRMVFEKYVYTPFLSGFEQNLRKDVNNLKSSLKGYLNLFQFYSKSHK